MIGAQMIDPAVINTVPNAVAIAADVSARYGCGVDPRAVQIVPVGASGRTLPVWNGRKLVQPDYIAQCKRDTASAWSRWRNGPLAEIRRAQLPDLVGAGLTDIQIANQLAVPVSVIVYDRGRLGLLANHGLVAIRRAKMAQIAALDHAAMTALDIAQLTGISPATVRNICRDFKLTIRRDDTWRVKGNIARTKVREARLAEILRLVRAGVNPHAVPLIIGAKPATVRADFNLLGIAFVDQTNRASAAAYAVRQQALQRRVG
jgi:hypothetical protein